MCASKIWYLSTLSAFTLVNSSVTNGTTTALITLAKCTFNKESRRYNSSDCYKMFNFHADVFVMIGANLALYFYSSITYICISNNLNKCIVQDLSKVRW